jgi:superoxide dismutase, Cu-Zn family
MIPSTKAAAAGLALAATMATGLTAQTGRAELLNAEGEAVAEVQLSEAEGRLRIAVQARGLEPGFHGFHIHAVGECEPPGFESAEGHLNPDGADHPDHAGDLPTLLVLEDGTAEMTVLTDRVTLADLLEGDGSAFIIHSDRDNHAHIPERYAEAPDEDTLDTGDAGDRVACGVVTQ